MAVSLLAVHAVARAQTTPAAPGAPASVGTAPGANVGAIVSGAKTINRVGALSYCVANHYVSYEQGWPMLQSLSASTGAVDPKNESGNMDYPSGVASLLIGPKDEIVSLDKADVPARQKICGQVMASLQSAT
ncbi:hypothetical protein AA103196_1343 [Ameyamaea chiangmaiensis NBRC 103196]|nr:hypothetical protein AA103196_1343 [Ameyamaea chiangmaiensis NBRC 103196]